MRSAFRTVGGAFYPKQGDLRSHIPSSYAAYVPPYQPNTSVGYNGGMDSYVAYYYNLINQAHTYLHTQNEEAAMMASLQPNECWTEEMCDLLADIEVATINASAKPLPLPKHRTTFRPLRVRPTSYCPPNAAARGDVQYTGTHSCHCHCHRQTTGQTVHGVSSVLSSKEEAKRGRPTKRLLGKRKFQQDISQTVASPPPYANPDGLAPRKHRALDSARLTPANLLELTQTTSSKPMSVQEKVSQWLRGCSLVRCDEADTTTTITSSSSNVCKEAATEEDAVANLPYMWSLLPIR